MLVTTMFSKGFLFKVVKTPDGVVKSLVKMHLNLIILFKSMEIIVKMTICYWTVHHRVDSWQNSEFQK